MMLLYFILLNALAVAIVEKVRVGKLSLSPIGFGTWSWGNRFLWQYDKENDNDLKKTFDFAVSKGVNWFDTADSYGTGDLSGRSEELLGAFSKSESVKGKSINICAKLAPYPWRIGEDSMLKALDSSISRVNEPVSMLQLHWPPSLGWQETEYLKAFTRSVTEGKATQIGLSNYGPAGLKKVAKILDELGGRVYSNQVQFSLLSRYPITNGLKETCSSLGVTPIGYSPLALGLLADKYTVDRLPRGPRGLLFREFLPIMTPLLDELRAVARYRRKTVSQVALNWNLRKGFLVLVGVRTVEQAKDNLGALGWDLTPAEILAVDVAAAKVPKQLIQNSFQSR